MSPLQNRSIATLADFARSLPVFESRAFLAGLLPLMVDAAEVAPLRTAYLVLNQCDDQLELISGAQGKLALSDAPLPHAPLPHAPARLVTWRQAKARIIKATPQGTVTAFAHSIRTTCHSMRAAMRGECPRVLSRMQAILGSLAA